MHFGLQIGGKKEKVKLVQQREEDDGVQRTPIARAGKRGQVSCRACDRLIGADVYYSARVSLGAWAHGQLRSGRPSESEALAHA